MAQDGNRHEPANAPEIRHVAFGVEDIYRLCYVRGPAGIIVSLAEELS
jgi:hypothetical protein